MSVAPNETPPSNQHATHEIPKQTSIDRLAKPVLKLIQNQPEAPIIENIPERKALTDTELNAVREKVHTTEPLSGSLVLQIILEQLGTIPPENDLQKAAERQAILDKIRAAEQEYKTSFFKQTGKHTEALDFDKFQELLDDTEEFEGDPVFVSITRAANFDSLRANQRMILEADRLTRIIYRDIKHSSTNTE